jgi:hypothetical protein
MSNPLRKEWEKMPDLLADPRIQQTISRSQTLAKQHKPFVAFLLFASFILFCMQLPWDGGAPHHSRPPPDSLTANGQLRPDLDPLFNRATPHENGSLEIIPDTPKKARWAKVAVASGFEDIVYERALDTHLKHAEKHGYPMYVGRENAADGMFNKIAFILHIVLQELYKPAQDRIEWIL